MGRPAAPGSPLLVSAVAALLCANAACGGASEPAPRPASPEPTPAEPEPAAAQAAPARPDPSPEQLATAAHVLNRFAFGPRPGEVEAVARMGPRQWLDRQLEPERIGDGAARRALEPHRLALRSPHELQQWYRRQVEDPDVRPGHVRREIQGHGQMAIIARHVASERQLEEVLVDFWTNHLNVNGRKGPVRFMVVDYVDNAIRPHVLGRYEDMLRASARHPAMLVYLDNAQSIAPGSQRRRPERGLNENYARELLELHTLGVDGGYTQTDVVEAARVLTGWGVTNIRREPAGFRFRERFHDRGAKTVMGRRFPAGGGEDEGVELLSFLAHHPSTARFLARKLLTRFVADEPPEDCIEPVAQRYLESGTDLRETMRAVIECPALWEPENRGQKLKTPLELVVSAIRALGGELTGEDGPARAAAALRQPVLMEPVPTGYPEVAEDWRSPGAMVDRVQFLGSLLTGRVQGVDIDLEDVVPEVDNPDAVAEAVTTALLAGRASAETRETIRAAAEEARAPERIRPVAVGLALASPEFQRQ